MATAHDCKQDFIKPQYQQLHEKRGQNEIRGPLIKKCWCFSLKTGCQIFGWLNIILYVVYIAISAIAMDYIRKKLEKTNGLQEHDSDNVNFLVNIFLAVLYIMLSVMILSNVLLLVGVYKKNPAFVKSFVVINSIIVVMAFVGVIQNVVSPQPYSQDVASSVAEIIYVILTIVVAHSHYKELLVEQRQHQEHSTISMDPPQYSYVAA